ncbi:uncharacterized protein LOC121687944 [Alosa sapidissima]|uniref:uncharacterized protein LOC121687944 n=1 Tax=Alosa sapidissima TaxID=34773 RepID=UPI001C08FE35|nr:uncharacterized protein LOC121687944 [Alosa sapidissima]
MDQKIGIQPCPPTELLLAAQAFVDNVVRESVILFTSGPLTSGSKGSILRKDVTAVNCGRTSPASPGPRISLAAGLNDGSERSWNQSSPGSADSFPFAVHPRCEDLIREEKRMFSGVYKTRERSADRSVRQPSPLSADLERYSPASSSVSEEMKSIVNKKKQVAPVSETSTLETMKVNEPRKSLRRRLQTGPTKIAPSVWGICSREGTREDGCCMLS